MADALDDLSEIEALARSAMADARVTSIAHASAQLHAHMSPARTLRLIERLREAERMAADDRESADTLALMLADARAQRDTWRITCGRMVEEPDQLAAAMARATAAEARATALEAALREAKAEAIYNSWKGVDGWVPWVPGGNSLKQDEARALTKETPDA